MIEVREATAADAAAILDLRRRCFPEDDIEKPFEPARAFIAADGTKPVAHLAFEERTYTIEGRHYAGVLAFDAMTDPAYRRQGLFRRVGAFAREALRGDYALSTAWQIRPAVLGAMVANGWMPILRAPVWVRPLLFPSRLRRADPERQPALPHSERFAAPYYARLTNGRAYIVTRETTLRGHRTLAVADIRGPARPLLRQAFARARGKGIRLAAALMSLRHPSLPLLLSMGFLPSPHRFRFLVNVFDPRIDPRRVRWALTWADTDHL